MGSIYLFVKYNYSQLFILLVLARMNLAVPIDNDRRQDILAKKESEDLNHCDFNNDLKIYNPSDLLRCFDDIARKEEAMKKGGENSGTIFTDKLNRLIEALRDKEETSYRYYSRERLGPYGSYNQVPESLKPERPIYPEEYPPFYSAPEGSSAYPDSYYPSGFQNSALVDALTSISRYDDLKCVPRLICEISTGSKPGNADHRASTLADFGKSTLVGLLTSYNFERASPILGFAKAALLGYTSKDDSSICYKEYRRCPRDQRDLIHYLNNHNGGFFRFFKNSRRNSVTEGSNRADFARKEPAPPPGLSGPESDRTGTGELKFDTSEPSPRQEDSKINTLRSRNDVNSKVVFPDETQTDYRVSKSIKSNPISPGFFPSFNSYTEFSTPSFFPSDNDGENDQRIANIVIFKNENDEDDSMDEYEDSDSHSGEKERPNRASDADSAITFPEYHIDGKVRFESDIILS